MELSPPNLPQTSHGRSKSTRPASHGPQHPRPMLRVGMHTGLLSSQRVIAKEPQRLKQPQRIKDKFGGIYHNTPPRKETSNEREPPPNPMDSIPSLHVLCLPIRQARIGTPHGLTPLNETPKPGKARHNLQPRRLHLRIPISHRRIGGGHNQLPQTHLRRCPAHAHLIPYPHVVVQSLRNISLLC